MAEGSGTIDRRRHLDQVIEEARGCTFCPTMHGRPRVLGPKNGTVEARCLVIAEAPGPRGAGRTGVPLHGDPVGDHFEALLAQAGIGREELFITNAVLCSPEAAAGRTRKPSRAEILRCTHYISALLAALDVVLVVTLGETALRALDAIAPHGLSLRHDVGEARRWNGRFLLALYHPSSRAMIHRSWAQQSRDYALWRSLLHRG